MPKGAPINFGEPSSTPRQAVAGLPQRLNPGTPLETNTPMDKAGPQTGPVPAKLDHDCWSVPDVYSQLFFTGQTSLSVAFFSPKNVDYIRTQVSKNILKNYGIDIGPQPYRPAEVFMMKAYNDVSCDMEQTRCIPQKVQWLNQYTLKGLEERIMRNLGQHIGYLRWMDEASHTVKIDRPIYTGIYGSTLSLSRYYNGCPYQK